MKLRPFLGLVRLYRGALLLLASLMLIETSVTLVLPWLGGQLAGQVLTMGGTSLAITSGLIVLALAVLAALRAAMGIVAGRTSSAILADLRVRVHAQLLVLPIGFHQRHTQGDLLSLSAFEVGRLGDLLTVTLAGFPAQLLSAFGAIILMALLDPMLAWLVPLAVPVFYLALKVVGRNFRQLGRSVQEAEALVAATFSEDLAMLPATKAFTREEATTRRYTERVERSRDILVRENAAYSILGAVTGFLSGAAAVILVTLAAGRLGAGEMSPAELVSFLLYAALLTRPVAALAQVYGQVQSARGTLTRLGDILESSPEPGRDNTLRLDRANGAISLEGVHFAYPGRPSALRGISLEIHPGEIVGLTGPNGAGKSTLIALLTRMIDPQHGLVRLDGTDIRQVRLDDLRRQIGLVPQRALLFDGTVWENIAFGKEGASDAEVEAAARVAQAHDFILDLPEGYTTRIGEHGVRLSGGQGQRLALARALLKNPPILILDEATSMYDLEGESAFVAAAGAALRGRTVILITHRPASLALADRIVTLNQGRVVEERSAA